MTSSRWTPSDQAVEAAFRKWYSPHFKYHNFLKGDFEQMRRALVSAWTVDHGKEQR